MSYNLEGSPSAFRHFVFRNSKGKGKFIILYFTVKMLSLNNPRADIAGKVGGHGME